VVYPGKRLSLQRHKHRSEQWTIVIHQMDFCQEGSRWGLQGVLGIDYDVWQMLGSLAVFTCFSILGLAISQMLSTQALPLLSIKENHVVYMDCLVITPVTEDPVNFHSLPTLYFINFIRGIVD